MTLTQQQVKEISSHISKHYQENINATETAYGKNMLAGITYFPYEAPHLAKTETLDDAVSRLVTTETIEQLITRCLENL